MEEKAFFTAKEREQLFALYKRLLQLSGDTLQKGDCHKLKIHLIKAVAEGNLPRNCFGMNPIIKDMQTAVGYCQSGRRHHCSSAGWQRLCSGDRPGGR